MRVKRTCPFADHRGERFSGSAFVGEVGDLSNSHALQVEHVEISFEAPYEDDLVAAR
jgi:hypothetical protein